MHRPGQPHTQRTPGPDASRPRPPGHPSQRPWAHAHPPNNPPRACAGAARVSRGWGVGRLRVTADRGGPGLSGPGLGQSGQEQWWAPGGEWLPSCRCDLLRHSSHHLVFVAAVAAVAQAAGQLLHLCMVSSAGTTNADPSHMVCGTAAATSRERLVGNRKDLSNRKLKPPKRRFNSSVRRASSSAAWISRSKLLIPKTISDIPHTSTHGVTTRSAWAVVCGSVSVARS